MAYLSRPYGAGSGGWWNNPMYNSGAGNSGWWHRVGGMAGGGAYKALSNAGSRLGNFTSRLNASGGSGGGSWDIGDIFRSYLDRANAANDARASGIEKLYEGMKSNLSGIFGTERKRATERAEHMNSRISGDMIDRGLSSTTAGNAGRVFNERELSDTMRQISDQEAFATNSIDQQLANFRERQDDIGPMMEQAEMVGQMFGRGGGGGYASMGGPSLAQWVSPQSMGYQLPVLFGGGGGGMRGRRMAYGPRGGGRGAGWTRGGRFAPRSAAEWEDAAFLGIPTTGRNFARIQNGRARNRSGMSPEAVAKARNPWRTSPSSGLVYRSTPTRYRGGRMRPR